MVRKDTCLHMTHTHTQEDVLAGLTEALENLLITAEAIDCLRAISTINQD